jgi:hypothetical protein
VRNHSLVIGLTDANSPAHFATLLVRRLSFGLISNFVFLYGISTGRTQHQIPKLRQCSRCKRFIENRNKLKYLLRHIAKVILSVVLLTQQSHAQTEKNKTYSNEHFSIDYPNFWEMTNEEGILNFFPKENYGAITVSSHSGIDYPIEKTRNFILDIYEIKDNPRNVKMTKKGNGTEFYYEHIDKNIKWITKAIRKNDTLYLLTINCDMPKWESEKHAFIKSLESFKIK